MIDSLLEANEELKRQNLLFSDQEQQYEEVEQVVYYYPGDDLRKKPIEVTKKLGFIHRVEYFSNFLSDGTEEKVPIKRKFLVTVNGSFEFKRDFMLEKRK